MHEVQHWQKHIVPKQAAAVCCQYALPDELAKLLVDDPTPLRFMDRLLSQGEAEPEAVAFLAHALPKRLAIWWGTICVWILRPEDLPPAELEAIATAVRWVANPNEDHRWAAQKAAQAVGPGSPAGLLAGAVFESGCSLLPPDLPVVKPGPTMTAQGVRDAIHMAVLATPADELASTYRRCIALGIGIAIAKKRDADV